jgi:hypothetical protein
MEALSPLSPPLTHDFRVAPHLALAHVVEFSRWRKPCNISRHAALLIYGNMLRISHYLVKGRKRPESYCDCAFNSAADGYLRSECSCNHSVHRLRNLLPLQHHTFQVSMMSQHSLISAVARETVRTHFKVSLSPTTVKLRLLLVMST